MAKYIKRQIEIEAVRFSVDEILPDWFLDRMIDNTIITHENGTCDVYTLDGNKKVNKGDYIILDTDGHLSVCKKNKFEKEYVRNKGNNFLQNINYKAPTEHVIPIMLGEIRYLETIQKENKLNDVFSADTIGPGEANHVYGIDTHNNEDIKTSQLIFMQKGPRNEKDSVDGATNEDLLEIVRDRLKSFQNGEYACEYNEKALEHIEDALTWLNDRTKDRAKRNVLGKYEK